MKIRLNALQFLRFLAFLAVFALHAFPQGISIFSFSGLADAAFFSVSFFLVLSGFVSALKSTDQMEDHKLRIILKYVWKKLKKFYPLYFLLLSLSFIYYLIQVIGNDSYEQISMLFMQYVKCAFLLETWIDKNYFFMVWSGWFISVIFFMYILEYPLLGLTEKTEEKYSVTGLVILLACVITGDFLLQYYFHVRLGNSEFWNYIFPPARLGEYFSGMIVCRIIRPYLQKNTSSHKMLYTLPEIAGLCLPVVMIQMVHTEEWMQRSILWLIPALFLTIIFSLERGYLSALFSKNIPVFLGDIEFECYLLHEPCILVTSYVWETGTMMSGLTGLILTIILASVLYEWKKKNSVRSRKLVSGTRMV